MAGTAIDMSLAQQAVEEAQARADLLSYLVDDIRARLEAERASGPPALAVLQAAQQVAQAEMDRIQAEIDQAKSLAKMRKREIDELKQRYYGLAGIDKQADWAKLSAEISPRAVEINALQDQIGTLEAAKLAAMGNVEAAKQSVAALEAGAYTLPVEADPRMLSVLKAREAALADLAAARDAHNQATAKPADPHDL
jgi:predicted  nucleic acid-binding Zn-ribbon protein